MEGEKAGKTPTALGAEPTLDAPIVLGRDFSRSGFDGGTSPIKLKSVWNFRPDETMFLAVPIVAGKRIYAAACQADVSGYTGLLACLDADSGKPLWQITQAGDAMLKPFYSSPALTKDGKYILIGQGLHEDHDCALLCFEAATGQLRWSIKTSLHIESSPAIFGDIVVVGAARSKARTAKRPATRAMSLPCAFPMARNYGGIPSMIRKAHLPWMKREWYSSAADSMETPLYAIHSAPDEELAEKKLDRIAWHTDIGLPVVSAITLAEDKVIAGAGNSDFVYSNPHPRGLVIALDRKTGDIVWQTKFDDAVLGEIAYHEGKLICPVRSGEIAALNPADGRVLWRTRLRGKVPMLAGCAFDAHANLCSEQRWVSISD